MHRVFAALLLAACIAATQADDCVPIAAGIAWEASACCSLSPFNSICTKSPPGSGNVVVASSTSGLMKATTGRNHPRAPSNVPRPVDKLPASHDNAILGHGSVTVTLNSSNPQVNFTLNPGTLDIIVGTYTLQLFNDRENDFAVRGNIQFVVPDPTGGNPCIKDQLIGSLGVPALFANAKCVQICAMGACSPWDFCGVPHSDGIRAAWFGLRIGNRLFDTGLLSLERGIGQAQQTFQVSEMTNCGTNPCIDAISTTVVIQDDPAAGGWDLVVTQAQWSQCQNGPYVTSQPTTILTGGSSARKNDDDVLKVQHK